MKRVLTLAVCSALVSVSSAGADGELYVVRVGDGQPAPPTLTSAPVQVDRYSPAGAHLGTIELPTVAAGQNRPLSLAFGLNSHGFLKRSADGRYLTLAGFATEPGTASVLTTSAADVPRVVGRIDLASGAVDTSTALDDGLSFSSGLVRSAVTDDGTGFWIAGASSAAGGGGVRYAAHAGSTSVQVSSPPDNVRVVDIVDGQLYASTTVSPYVGVNSVGNGLPTAAGQTTSLLAGFPGSHDSQDYYDFWFKDENTLYVADGRASSTLGGIHRWDYNSGTSLWEFSYNITSSSATAMAALAGTIVDGQAVLYATTTANTIVTVTDTGPGSMVSTLATAPDNTRFRGVAFIAPDPGAIDPDFNGDGVVDTADYVLWRKSGGPAVGYEAWRAAYGSVIGGQAAADEFATLPEPAGAATFLIALSCLAGGGRRRGRQP